MESITNIANTNQTTANHNGIKAVEAVIHKEAVVRRESDRCQPVKHLSAHRPAPQMPFATSSHKALTTQGDQSNAKKEAAFAQTKGRFTRRD
jgi:hypothetical protein